MASDFEFVNYKQFVENLPVASSYATGDKSVVSNGTNGPRQMPQTTAEKIAAQNALAGNVAPAFDPTRTSDNPYKAGDKVIFNGRNKFAIDDSYGAYDNDLFADYDLSDGKVTLSGKSHIYIDNDYTFVQNNAFYGKFVKIPSGVKSFILNNVNTSYAVRCAFVTSKSMEVGELAPVAEYYVHLVSTNNKLEITIPSNAIYVYFWTYTKFDFSLTFSTEDKVHCTYFDGLINTDGSLVSSNQYTTYILDVVNFAGKYLKVSTSDNVFSIGYSCNTSPLKAGSSIDLLEDSAICNFIGGGVEFIPIPEGVKFVVMSCYTREGGGLRSFDLAEKRDDLSADLDMHKIDSASSSTKVAEYAGGKYGYGDEIIMSITGTYNSNMRDIKFSVTLVDGLVDIEYFNYGFIKYKINTPVMPRYRLTFNSISGVVIYTVKVGFWQNYKVNQFRFATINAGNFDHGESTSSTIPDEDGDEFVKKWQTMLKSIGADVIGFCEWAEKMTSTNNYPPKRKLLNCYQNVHEKVGGTGSGYNRKAIASIFESKDWDYVVYANQGSEIPRAFFYEKIQLNGREVYIVETHLELIASYRALQMNELIAFCADKKYVVIGGDFNAENATEFEPFTQAGYDMANCGMWGENPTSLWNSLVPISNNYPNDNIMTKGLKIKNVGYIGDADVTDHKAVFADVYFIDM